MPYIDSWKSSVWAYLLSRMNFPDLNRLLNKSLDTLRTNGKLLIPFVVSLSNHIANQLVQLLLNATSPL